MHVIELIHKSWDDIHPGFEYVRVKKEQQNGHEDARYQPVMR